MIIGVRVLVNGSRAKMIVLSSGGTDKVYCRLLVVGRVVVQVMGSLAQGARWKAWLIRSWLLWTVRVAVLLAFGIVLEGGGREGGRMQGRVNGRCLI